MTGKGGNVIVLEIYLTSINLSKTLCCIDENHETCFGFKCLNIISFEISHKNHSKQQNNSTININRGKSCLVALTSDELAAASQNFEIQIEVWQKIFSSCLPSKFTLGTATINITEEFNQLIGEENSKKIQSSFSFYNPEKEEVGTLDLIITIANLDKMITDIKYMPTENNSEDMEWQEHKDAPCSVKQSEYGTCNSETNKLLHGIDDPSYCTDDVPTIMMTLKNLELH